jgi:two-component system, cell cycle sensor histidine kinase and response regulator CckA
MQQHLASGNNREIERLYRLDYGDVGEFWFRMVGSLLGAGIIWLYTGWILAWVWIGAYATLQLGFFLFLRSKLKNATPTDVLVAYAIFPLMLTSFIWMPILMITSPDDVLSVSGFSILSGVFVFVVRRSEEFLKMMLLEIAILTVCLGVGVAVILARYDDPFAWLGLVFGTITLIFYVTQAAMIVRRQRIRVDEIAGRTSQAEKLEAIGKLAGGVAHDFNNLLTVILGNLDLIKEVQDPLARAELLDEARSATLRGAKVVRQLLAYARQTDGSPHMVDASDLLRSVEALCKTFIPESITLKISLPSTAISVGVDDSLFVTAVLNLIKNGLDAIEGPGQITVTAVSRHLIQPLKCTAGQLLPAGHFVVFAVTDTGNGIPIDIVDRVADPFFTTKAVGKGSGLGLSMVSGFAMQAGGGLEIQSSKKGTVVSIFLPAIESSTLYKS